MRNLIILLLLIACSEPFEFDAGNFSIMLHHYPGQPKEEEMICFFSPESMPSYPGGMSALYQFIQGNLKCPKVHGCLKGKVFVSFAVDVDGAIEELKIVKGLGRDYDQAVLEVFEIMPYWIPGTYQGNPQKMKMMLPITFR